MNNTAPVITEPRPQLQQFADSQSHADQTSFYTRYFGNRVVNTLCTIASAAALYLKSIAGFVVSTIDVIKLIYDRNVRIVPQNEVQPIVRRANDDVRAADNGPLETTSGSRCDIIPQTGPTPSFTHEAEATLAAQTDGKPFTPLTSEEGLLSSQILSKRLQNIANEYTSDYFGGKLTLELCEQYESEISYITRQELRAQTLFRLDSRPPETIFPLGFVAKDESQAVSLRNHILETTKKSQYISTTSRPMSLLSNYSGNEKRLYIYVFEKRNLDSIYIPTCQDIPLRNRVRYLYQSEHTFTARIPNSNILGAYLTEDGRVISWSKNPYYTRYGIQPHSLNTR